MLLYEDSGRRSCPENVFIWRICSWSFISVKLLGFLCSWHNTVPCSPCSWAFSAWYLSSEPTQSNSPRMHSALNLEFACDLPPLHLAEELTVAAWVEVLYLPAQSNCCLCPSLLQAGPRLWQQIRGRAHCSSGVKRKGCEDTNYVGISLHLFLTDNLKNILFWDISEH